MSLMTIEINEYRIDRNNRSESVVVDRPKITFLFRLARPNGCPHESGTVEIDLGAVNSCPPINRDLIEHLELKKPGIYFSEIFLKDVGKTFVMCFGGRDNPPETREEFFISGPLVLQE